MTVREIRLALHDIERSFASLKLGVGTVQQATLDEARQPMSPWSHSKGSTPAFVLDEERWRSAFHANYKIEAARKAVRAADRALFSLDAEQPILPYLKREVRRRRK